MKNILLVLIINVSIFPQLSKPTPEAVYGGRINAITSIPLNSTQTRVFVSTESANSIFYLDMTTADTSIAPTFGSFTVMPGIGDDDGSRYYSVKMIGDSTNYVYVENVRVYKTSDGGTDWTQVFTAENVPYSFTQIKNILKINY